MDVLQPQSPDEFCYMIDDGGHGVVFDPLRVVGVALAQAVEHKDVRPFGEPIEIAAPIRCAVRTQVGAEVATMHQMRGSPEPFSK